MSLVPSKTVTTTSSKTPIPNYWALPNIQNWAVGFERHWDLLNMLQPDINKATYPPYNIIKMDENVYVIELALAGFLKEEIKITQDENILTIEGVEGKEAVGSYVHKGIAARDFRREFALADYTDVVEAEFVNGVLRVIIFQEIPEEKRPKTINIK